MTASSHYGRRLAAADFLEVCVFMLFFLLTRSAQSLEKEVQEVKSTLQAMFAQLKEEGEEGEELNDQIQNSTEEEEEDEEQEEEDQYFSDSWDIWDKCLEVHGQISVYCNPTQTSSFIKTDTNPFIYGTLLYKLAAQVRQSSSCYNLWTLNVKHFRSLRGQVSS